MNVMAIGMYIVIWLAPSFFCLCSTRGRRLYIKKLEVEDRHGTSRLSLVFLTIVGRLCSGRKDIWHRCFVREEVGD